MNNQHGLNVCPDEIADMSFTALAIRAESFVALYHT